MKNTNTRSLYNMVVDFAKANGLVFDVYNPKVRDGYCTFMRANPSASPAERAFKLAQLTREAQP
jgi:hypothetical protein